MDLVFREEVKKISGKMLYKDMQKSGLISIKEKEAYNKGVMDLADELTRAFNL